MAALDTKDVARKLIYQDSQILDLQGKLLSLNKQVESLESGLPGDIQMVIKAKNREIADLTKELQGRTTATHQPKDTSNTEDSLIALSRKRQQFSASEYDERLKALAWSRWGFLSTRW